MNSDDHIDAMHERAVERAMKEFDGLPPAKLERMRRDLSLPEFERDAAGKLYDAHEAVEKEAARRAGEKQDAIERGAADRSEARRLARETVDDAEVGKTLPAATGQRRASEGLSANQAAAENFAEMLRYEGLNAKARPTRRIQGRDVLDGWTVNVRDDEIEAGIVACWYGRRHFLCYFEIAGHLDRSAEAALAVIAAVRSVRESHYPHEANDE